jgi:multidrug resistance efflux pump
MRRALTLLTLAFTACFNGYSSDEPPSSSELRVHRGAFESDVVLTGELDAERGEQMSVPRLPVWQSSIKWIAADGSEVKAGDKVVELDNTSITSTLDQQRQTLIQNEQELTQKAAEWSASLAQKRLDLEKRKVELDKAAIDGGVDREVLAAREYSERQVKLTRAKVEYAKARDLVTSTERSIASDRANLVLKRDAVRRELKTKEEGLSAAVLTAPRDGIVVLRDHPWEGRRFQEGDGVWVGMALALIPELDSMRVVAALADVDDRKIAVGMPASVILDAYPDRRFRGRIADISAIAQESAKASMRRSFRVAVKLDELDFARMRPGLSARVIIRRDVSPTALLAPRAALDFTSAKPKARTSSGKLVDVTLGACNAQECIVTGGLNEGDQLAPARRQETPDA